MVEKCRTGRNAAADYDSVDLDRTVHDPVRMFREMEISSPL